MSGSTEETPRSAVDIVNENDTDGRPEDLLDEKLGEYSLEDLPGPDWEGMTVPTDDLHVDGENPNEMADDMFAKLVDNILTYGWRDPILATGEGLVSDGEHRLKVARLLGLERVPAIADDDLDEADRRYLRQTMNKIHGEHDEKRDALEFDWLAEHGKRDDVLDLLDVRGESFDDYMEMIRLGTPDFEREQTSPPQGKIHFEDCVKGMRERLEPNSVDCVVTDPPYGVNVDLESSMGRKRDVQHAGDVEADADLADALCLWDQTLDEIDRVTKPDSHLYCFASWKTANKFRELLEAHGWQINSLIVWVKKDANHLTQFGGSKARYGYKHEWCLFAVREDSDPRPINGHPNDVYVVSEPRFESEFMRKDVQHPTMKPTELLESFIENSTSEGDRVLDPFMGSASTAVAALTLGRDVVGFEVDEDSYRSVINRRVNRAQRQRNSAQNRDENSDSDSDSDTDEDGGGDSGDGGDDQT